MFKADLSDASATCKIDTVVTSELTKLQLYSNALNFIAKNFKNSNNVIQSKDLELGEIIVKGNIVTYIKDVKATKKSKGYRYDSIISPLRVHFNANVYTRDNKYKIDISSLKYDVAGLDIQMPVYIESKADITEDIAARAIIKEFIIEFARGVGQKPLNDF